MTKLDVLFSDLKARLVTDGIGYRHWTLNHRGDTFEVELRREEGHWYFSCWHPRKLNKTPAKVQQFIDEALREFNREDWAGNTSV